MTFFRLYFLLLKATATTFAGLASLPVIRDELVVARHMLTDEQLSAAIVITRSTPGPVGLYVVSVGYFADGLEGAVAGWLAMSTPALAIILLLRFVGPRATHPRIHGMLQAVVLASAGLLMASVLPLAREAIVGPITLTIALVGLAVLVVKKVDTLWVIAGGAIVSLASALLALPEIVATP